jgi:hypothetical protein
MKKILSILLFITCFAHAQDKETKEINDLLNNWHKAAAEVRFDDYMNALTNDAIYIGTDASENWTKKDYMAYSKPHFDKGKAWSFTALERHVYFDKTFKMAWFDELLNTQMKICRGSGVLVKIGQTWKIKHYVLSMTVPNDNTKEVVKIKTVIEDKLIDSIKKN